MKKTMKGLLSLLLIMCVLSLYNCEKDGVAMEGIGEENGHNSLFSKGKLNQYSKLATYVDELKQHQETGSLNKNASLGNSNNFIILENEEVSVYTTASSTTYTIPIHKANQAVNTFSNLVVKFSDTEATKVMIMNYEPSQSYLDAIVTNDQAPYSGYASYEAVSYDGSLDHLAKGCRTVSMTYCDWGDEGTHTAGPNCTPSYMWTVRTIFCDDATDPPPALINTGGVGTGGNNGSSVPPPNDDEIVTTPITKTEAQEIASQLDEVFGEGNWEHNDNLPDDAPNFESIEELEAFLDRIVSGNFSLESSQMIDEDNGIREDVHRIKINDTPATYIKTITRVQTPTTGNGLQRMRVLSMNSYMDTNLIIFDWLQTTNTDVSNVSNGPIVDYYTVSNGDNKLRVSVNGQLILGFKIGGYPVGGTKQLKMVISYFLDGINQIDPNNSYWVYL